MAKHLRLQTLTHQYCIASLTTRSLVFVHPSMALIYPLSRRFLSAVNAGFSHQFHKLTLWSWWRSFLTNRARATRFLLGYWSSPSKSWCRSCVNWLTGPYRAAAFRHITVCMAQHQRIWQTARRCWCCQLVRQLSATVRFLWLQRGHGTGCQHIPGPPPFWQHSGAKTRPTFSVSHSADGTRF